MQKRPLTRRKIADILEQGVAEDIWYDAWRFDDPETAKAIIRVQDAMQQAAVLLRESRKSNRTRSKS